MKHTSFLFLAILLVSRLANATVVKLPTDDELVVRADVIALVEVTRLEVVRSDKGRIRTFAELRVERGVRGASAGDFIAMSYPGGVTSNNLVASVSGTPSLEVGDTVFVYLSSGKDAYHPIGFRYGVLNTHRGRDGAIRVNRSIDGLTFVRPGGAVVDHKTLILKNVVLEELITDINARMKRLNVDPQLRVLPHGPSATAIGATHQ